MLEPIGNAILFTFLADQAEGKFIDSAKAGIIMTNLDVSNQGKVPRWGRVVSVGPDVDADIQPGKFVLIEPLRWTIGFKYDGVQIWKTDNDQVLCLADNIEDTLE